MRPSPNIDLKLLQSLVALVTERSVTRAAERMGVSQPRMSNVLARLRHLFADPLLVRTGSGMIPTERATQIAATLREGLAQVDSALASQRPFDPAKGEDIRFVLAMSDYVSTLMMAPLMRLLAETAPNVRIVVKMTDPARVQTWLETRECDLAFGLFMHLGESLRASPLLADTGCCIVRNDHPVLESGLSAAAFAAAAHAVMGGEPAPVSTLEQMVEHACADLGFTRRVAVRAPSLVLIADMVAQTDLVATVPRRLGLKFEEDIGVRHLPLPLTLPPINVTMVWHEQTHRHPAQVWLRQQIRAVVRDCFGEG